MAYRKKTLRQLKPVSREIAKTVSKLQSCYQKLKGLIDEVNYLEIKLHQYKDHINQIKEGEGPL